METGGAGALGPGDFLGGPLGELDFVEAGAAREAARVASYAPEVTVAEGAVHLLGFVTAGEVVNFMT